MASSTPHDRNAFLAALPRAFVAASALVTDGQGRVLLLKSYRRWWQWPGGVCEPHEGPAACARRELLEETGLDLEPGALLVVSWITAGGTSLQDMPGVQLHFDFGSVPTGTPLRLQEDEIDSALWIDAAEGDRYAGPLRARRVRAALAARQDGRTRVLVSSRAELEAEDA
ncbi:NUDIX domain-containing protein [Streptacidiphilus monticola]|jgi:8-oxo-dGTP pyrophosphatase MutT (NUDIX family)|uniref:NUDIX domain-containing protein n=1 Tax=Streptacidiphilus monticola TaxID=2161674 RepID=A0ABW1GBQ8_9ACTN